MAKLTPREEADLLEEAIRIKKAQQGTPATKARPANTPHPDSRDHGGDVAATRTGEDPLSSRQFSIAKAFACVVKPDAQYQPDNAKIEWETLTKIRKAIVGTNSIISGGNPNQWWFPVDFSALPPEAQHTSDMAFARDVYRKSMREVDTDELNYLRQKFYKASGPDGGQSAYFDQSGATLVAPPVQGPVIPFIRPNAALLAAGARSLPLPPNGRWVQPRITGAPDVKAVGEGQTASLSNMNTDQLELQAKKIAGATRIPEEFTTFTSGAGDALVKFELERSLGLRMDAYGFYGAGTTLIPAGITSPMYQATAGLTGAAALAQTGTVINFQNAYPTSKAILSTGNVLLPQHGDQLPAQIAERSFGQDGAMGGWIMRPSVYAACVSQRADAVSAGDDAGVMVDILRRFAEKAPDMFRSRKVTQTTNLSNTGTNAAVGGSGTNLSDAFYGIWQYAIVATYGAVQITYGVTNDDFLRGQQVIRGVLWGDFGLEYPGAFLWCPYMSTANTVS